GGEEILQKAKMLMVQKLDLSFRAGERLEVLDASHEGWWYARLFLPTGSVYPGRKLQGYIPANYIAADQSIEAEP
uniref:SH3 domain-containing protein n=1 Tax=Accipiter nisus TaxID=211598 RepID=A0A8B9NH71_9AVES